MPSFFDVLIAIISITTLILLVRNIVMYDNFSNAPTSLKRLISITRISKGNAYTSEENEQVIGDYIALYKTLGLPSSSDVSRIKSIIKSSRLSISLVNNLIHIDKGRLIKYLEREIDRIELAYSTTGHVKYAERLKFLENLYKIVSRMHTPYSGSLSLIIWNSQSNDDDIHADVESLVKLLEAETGLTFKRVDSVRDLFTVDSPVDGLDSDNDIIIVDPASFDKPGVIAGFLDDDTVEPVVLAWPHDFEAHIGIFGPTGRGKTVLLAGIASQLGIRSESRGDPFMVLVLDPKGDLSRILSSIGPGLIRVGNCVSVPSIEGEASVLIDSSTRTSFGSSIHACEGSLLRRGFWMLDLSSLKPEDRSVAASLALTSILVEALERGLPGRVVVVIDEAWRLARGHSIHFEMALREGRSRGLHLVYATQSPADLPSGVLENTRTVFAFSGFSASYSEAVSRLGFDASLLSGMPIGTALLRLGDLGPYRVRIPDFRKLLKTPYYSYGVAGD